MKQKRLGNILYVFDVNPYEITQDTDTEVVKVQEESFAGFIEMNPSLAEKIVKYNYHTMCVNVPEWAPYVDEEDPQEQLTFGIYGSAAEASITQVQRQNANNDILETWVAGTNLNFPFQASFNEGEHFAVEFVNGVNPYLLDITGDALSIGWQDAETNNFWRATTALSTSTSVGIDAAEPSTYKLYLQGTGINDTNLRVDIDSSQVALEDLVDGIDIAQETLIEVWLLTEDIKDYDVSSISTWMNESTDGGHLHYWRNMPPEDKTINIPFLGDGVNFDVSWSSGSPENVSQINIGSTSVTSNEISDPNWEDEICLYPGTSEITFFVSTGLPTDMSYFGVIIDHQNFTEYHVAYQETDPDTGEITYRDADDAEGSLITNPGTWTYNNTPDSGLPWIAFTLPATDIDGNAYTDNTVMEIKINSRGS